MQYPEEDITSIDTLLNIPITSPDQKTADPAAEHREVLTKQEVPAEVIHTNLQPTMDLTMGVHGRDLGHVAADVSRSSPVRQADAKDGGWTSLTIPDDRRRARSRWKGSQDHPDAASTRR